MARYLHIDNRPGWIRADSCSKEEEGVLTLFLGLIVGAAFGFFFAALLKSSKNRDACYREIISLKK